MAKKIIKTRTSPKQVLAEYKSRALSFIAYLKNPGQQLAFSIAGYETTPTGKKPNALSAPELLAIVGTAAKLGKNVQVKIAGSGDGATLYFYFVDQPANTPLDLL